MISTYYKDGVDILDLIKQPMSFLHTLYYLAIKEFKTDAGKAKQANNKAAREMGV